jgi:hypothetical protein
MVFVKINSNFLKENCLWRISLRLKQTLKCFSYEHLFTHRICKSGLTAQIKQHVTNPNGLQTTTPVHSI